MTYIDKSLDGISKAGEVIVSKVNIIVGPASSKTDISGLFVEMSLYEDVAANSMHGSMTITENFNMIHDLPIIGEEYLEIEFSTPGIDKTFSRIFFIYGIGRRIMDGNSKNLYLLNFITPETRLDMNNKISKSFTGMPGEIINKIFSDYLESDRKLEISPSSNLIKFVAPYWSPYKCINYVASHSMGTDSFRTPSYLFFETNQTFKFASLSELMKLDPITEFYFDKNVMRTNDAEGGSTRNIDREYKTVEKFDIIEATDYITRLLDGIYSNKVIFTNILNKTIGKNVYNYWYDFDKTGHVGKYPTHSRYVQFHNENCKISSTVISPMVHDTIKKDFNAEIQSKRIPLLMQLDMFKIEISVPGRLGIEVGNTVKMNLMNYGTKDESDKNTSDMDAYYSGKYLIMAMKHRITKTRHDMTLELIKDSFENKVEFKDTL